MKSNNVHVMMRITSCYGYNNRSRLNMRPRAKPELVLRRLSSTLNSKLWKINLCLAYPRAIHVFAPHAGLYYKPDFQHEVRKFKINSGMAMDLRVSEDATYIGSNFKAKKESAFQETPLNENKNKIILNFDEHFRKKFFGLVEPCVKTISPSPDDIQIKNKVKYENDTYAIHDKYPVKYAFPTTFISTLSVPFQKDAFISSFNSNRCNSSWDAGIDVRNVYASHILYSSMPGEVSPPKENKPENLGRPSEDQLNKIFNILNEQLPAFFSTTMNYTIYTPNVVLDNRIRGTYIVGIFPYMRQMSLLRVVGHFKYAYVNFEVVKITKHPEEGTVKVRWRIVGVSALKALPFLFTLKSYDMKTAKEKMDYWYEGISTFYVNENGLIYKHVVDNKITNEQVLKTKKATLLARLTAILGRIRNPVASQPAVTSAAMIFETCNNKGVTFIEPKRPDLLSLQITHNA